ncbi:MAG TPA: DUF922 domain-containing protein [Polyangiaceae bacterium]|nr:DUF922 domain-containing protein [Polyangiaceae bacterium]
MTTRAWRVLGAVLVLGACGAPQLDPAIRARLPHSAPPEVGDVAVTRSEASYAVRGLSRTELRKAIHDQAAANWSDSEAAGLTLVNMRTKLSCQEYSDGGALRSGAIDLSLVVELPAWQDAGQAPAPLQAAWNSFLTALRAHEEGHVEIAGKYATALHNALQSLPPEDSCPTLLTKAQALVDRAGAKMNAAQADYDAKTNHGGTQGCVL